MKGKAHTESVCVVWFYIYFCSLRRMPVSFVFGSASLVRGDEKYIPFPFDGWSNYWSKEFF